MGPLTDGRTYCLGVGTGPMVYSLREGGGRGEEGIRRRKNKEEEEK
jgi:hypothetical protein